METDIFAGLVGYLKDLHGKTDDEIVGILEGLRAAEAQHRADYEQITGIPAPDTNMFTIDKSTHLEQKSAEIVEPVEIVEWVDEVPEGSAIGDANYWGLKIKANQDVSYVYAQVALYDGNGSNIDWSNDTAHGLRAGDTAILVFTSCNDAAQTARITELKVR